MKAVVRPLLVCSVVAFALVPSLGAAQPSPPPAWEAQWDAAWTRSTTYYRIQVADTLASDAGCQGLELSLRIKELVRAIAARRYGEATRVLSIVQDKSMCLTLEGARGLEFALAGFMHRAMTQLTGTGRRSRFMGR